MLGEISPLPSTAYRIQIQFAYNQWEISILGLNEQDQMKRRENVENIWNVFYVELMPLPRVSYIGLRTLTLVSLLK